MHKLTAKQAKAFSFIKSFITRKGHGPTARELAEYLAKDGQKVYKNNGQSLILALERKGLIRRKLDPDGNAIPREISINTN
ncbi:MAG: hypothetical protein KGJ13_04320 [Patescibacteria group bacterium]|nr:hypothetical protein [Patescibacteria group bacterium]